MSFGDLKRFVIAHPVAIGLSALAIYAVWPKEPTAAEKRAAALDAIGNQASVMAGMVIAAQAGCNPVGVRDLEQCSTITGTLIEEKVARLTAQAALQSVADFMKQCKQDFGGDYCSELANRALLVASRSSARSGNSN